MNRKPTHTHTEVKSACWYHHRDQISKEAHTNMFNARVVLVLVFVGTRREKSSPLVNIHTQTHTDSKGLTYHVCASLKSQATNQGHTDSMTQIFQDITFASHDCTNCDTSESLAPLRKAVINNRVLFPWLFYQTWLWSAINELLTFKFKYYIFSLN